MFVALIVFPSFSWGGAPIRAEHETGLLHSITHLPATIYLILFCIFILSVINLAVQGHLLERVRLLVGARFSGNNPREDSNPIGMLNKMGSKSPSRNFKRSIRGPESYRMTKEPLHDGIVSVRAVSPQPNEKLPDDPILTPLDGEDHPMPDFTAASKPGPVSSRGLQSSEKDRSLSPKEFKFSSAVDLPSQKELERREKEKIVVTGRVLDPSSNGLTTAVVYLVDKDGNKIGQSCRTNSEDGSYRVQANESGACSINVYKRGYLMNSEGPLQLPVKSGKLDGFDIPMIPEGCLIHGRVLSEVDQKPLEGLTVKCACRSEQFNFSVKTDSRGAFQAFGAPLNSECSIQVLSEDGEALVSSSPFETVQKKQIFMEFKVDLSGKQNNEIESKGFDDIEVIIDDPEPETPIQTSVL